MSEGERERNNESCETLQKKKTHKMPKINYLSSKKKKKRNLNAYTCSSECRPLEQQRTIETKQEETKKENIFCFQKT